MLRAMDSAVAGLRAHQNKLDVIGNNIANVNTFGYKSMSYSFKEAMYQTATASTGGGATAGGVNPAQYAGSCGVGCMISQIGDLAASAIKRNHDIKDYGKLIPGHGGILDRFDSVIFTAPIIYYLATFLAGRL